MKTICIIYRKNPGTQWQIWARTIAAAKFKVKIVDLERVPAHTADELHGDVFLLDGMQPNLAGCIKQLHRMCPDSRIIVATEVDSSRINYDVLYHNEALYVSGRFRPDEFEETIRKLASHEFAA